MERKKITFFNKKENYQARLEVFWEKEQEYRNLLVERYQHELDRIIKEFEDYVTTLGYTLKKGKKFIEVKYGDNYQVIRIDLNEIYPSEKYLFNLAIVEEARREYIISILPVVDNLHIPKQSNSLFRPKPRSESEIEKFNKDLERDYLFLDEKIKELKKMIFKLVCHDVNHQSSKSDEFEKFDHLEQILKKLTS